MTLLELFKLLRKHLALVVVLDMLNTRVRNPEEAEELLGSPVIGRIPTIKG